MKTKILLSLFVIMIFAACKKEKFNTAPTLTLKSVGNKNVRPGASLAIVFEITDKEGDISNMLHFVKTRTNRRPVSTQDNLGRDTLKFQVPDAPNTRSILMDLNLTYPLLQSSLRREPDSLTLKFWLVDKAKNRSDTFRVENVVIIK